MIYGENQVRQFYVMGTTNTFKNPTNTNKGYFVFDGVPTDKFSKGCIRDVRISKPAGFDVHKWTITMPTPEAGKDYFINLEFKNCFGFGENDRYIKFAVAHASSDDTVETLATTFITNLTKAFSREAVKPFASIEVDTTTDESGAVTSAAVVLTERTPSISTTDIIRGMMPLALDLTISLDTTDTTAWETEDNVVKAIASTTTNAYKVADMEYFFMKGRADMYGYMGFPDINPTEMKINPASTSDYYVLDIKYFMQEHGMLNQNSEKEMTIVGTSFSDLRTLAGNICTITGSEPAANKSLIGTVTFK